jgi:hypothetical protein
VRNNNPHLNFGFLFVLINGFIDDKVETTFGNQVPHTVPGCVLVRSVGVGRVLCPCANE